MDQSATLGPAEIEARLVAEFPQSFGGEGAYRVLQARAMEAQVLLPFHDRHLRPGGTVSGPAMFGLADCALYVAVLATIGWKPLAVTSDITMHFLSKPGASDMVGQARLLKVGRKLAVGEVYLRSSGSETVVAHATGTYSIPSA